MGNSITIFNFFQRKKCKFFRSQYWWCSIVTLNINILKQKFWKTLLVWFDLHQELWNYHVGQHDKINLFFQNTKIWKTNSSFIYIYIYMVRIQCGNFQFFLFMLSPLLLKYSCNKVQIFCLLWFFFKINVSLKNFLVHVLAPLSSNPSFVPACPKTFQWILKKLDNKWAILR